MDREKLRGLREEQYIEIIIELIDRLTASEKRIYELEAQISQNSTNSSKPPSSDGFNKPKSLREKSGKKRGGQFGHKGNGLRIEREPDKIVEHKAEVCSRCGANLRGIACVCAATRNVIDFEISVRIVQHKQMSSECPECGKINVGEMPEEASRSACYGAGLRSFSALLSNYACVSMGKIKTIFSDVFDINLSTGTIANINREYAKKSEPILKEIKAEIQKSPTINVDETGINNNGENWWIHTASTPKLTYMTAHRKRGREGIDDNGALIGYTGNVVHDCMAAYNQYKDCIHSLCNAHLLRELEWVCDYTSQTWAVKMQDLLLKMKAVKEKYIKADKTEISCYYSRKFADEYAEIVELAKSEVPFDSSSRKQHKSYNLFKRFNERHDEITRFIKNFDVPFDNNQAERDLRNTNIKEKSAGCFRSDDGVKGFAKISSVIGTAVKQGKSVFDTLINIASGNNANLFCQPTE
jgi:transposase